MPSIQESALFEVCRGIEDSETLEYIIRLIMNDSNPSKDVIISSTLELRSIKLIKVMEEYGFDMSSNYHKLLHNALYIRDLDLYMDLINEGCEITKSDEFKANVLFTNIHSIINLIENYNLTNMYPLDDLFKWLFGSLPLTIYELNKLRYDLCLSFIEKYINEISVETLEFCFIKLFSYSSSYGFQSNPFSNKKLIDLFIEYGVDVAKLSLDCFKTLLLNPNNLTHKKDIIYRCNLLFDRGAIINYANDTNDIISRILYRYANYDEELVNLFIEHGLIIPEGLHQPIKV